MVLLINSSKYGIKEIIIDDDDYEKIKNLNLWLSSSGGFLYVRFKLNKKNVSLHRYLTGALTRSVQVDHINHNTLDNRKLNLRHCTISENRKNSSKYKNNTTGYKGVCFFKPYNKYMAYIRVNTKSKFLGYYENINDAARAYNEAALKYHEEFACLNIIINESGQGAA